MRERTDSAEVYTEEIKVSGEELLKKVKELVEQGNARRIIVKDEKGNPFIEIPLTIGAVGTILAPALAALGAAAALLTRCTIVVVKRHPGENSN